MLYHLARFYDEWPGEDYDGSSCRGALKAWNKHGVCSDALWPYKTKDGRVRFIKPKPGWDLDAELHRLLGDLLGRDRRGEGGSLPRSLEALRPRAAPGQRVPVRVRDRDQRVVEGRLDVGHAHRHVAAGLLARRCCRCCRCCFGHLVLRMITVNPSRPSCRPPSFWGLCGCERWCGCAGRERAGCGDGADPDRIQSRSGA